jgi:hypothetical protein
MSRLGALANKIDRLETTLHDLTEALVRLRVASLRRNAEFHIGLADIEAAQQKMITFLQSVTKCLMRDSAFFALSLEERTWQALAKGLLASGDSAQDWYDDLTTIIQALEQRQFSKVNWPIVEKVLSTLDSGIADDLRRIEGW